MYLSTGSEERSKSDSHRPHFRLLCCLQFDWFVDYGKICKCTALILNLKWHLQADVGSVCYCHQIVQIGAKFMLVMGLFVSSVCTILFGWAKTNCLDCLISFSSNVNFFFFFDRLQITEPSSRWGCFHHPVLHSEVHRRCGLRRCHDLVFRHDGKNIPKQCGHCLGESRWVVHWECCWSRGKKLHYCYFVCPIIRT